MEWFPHPLNTYKKVMFENIRMLLTIDLSTIMSIEPHLFPVNLRRYQISWVTVSLQLSRVKVEWLRPQTHMEWFPHPLCTSTRCLIPFICCGWADGSTIMPLQLYLLAKSFGSRKTSWITARLQLDHSKAANDVKVDWLRPQTHMEWFPHPPYTSTRCLRPFICCGWADGSTIMPF